MMEQVWAVAWKEWKEILQTLGARGGARWGLIFSLALIGVFIPFSRPNLYVGSWLALLNACLAAFWVVTLIADSFAGERERHTLETLLATPLSDRAILFGKVGAAVAWGWGMALTVMLLTLITVNLAPGHSGLRLYPAAIGWSAVGLSLLGALFTAAAGVLVSLRASTVRQAQQTLGIGLTMLISLPVFGMQALSAQRRARLIRMLATAGAAKIALIVAAALAVADIALLVAVMARFRRARLILD